MKLYIKQYKPTDILKKQRQLNEYYLSNKNSIEIISEEGIFNIDNKKFHKINVILDKLVELKSNKQELLLDKSLYNSEIVHYLPFRHIDTHITSFYYAINSKSKIKLVIECKNETNKNEIIGNNFTDPINFYFEIPNEMTDFELLNNDDLNVFLSLLN